jgi:HD-GYP domain-containing protein (c-di-GMP phosphodiesterase class II)
MHVADSFEAMTAARPYRMTPLTEAQAVAELRKFGGIQFDPAVVDAFERLLHRRPGWARSSAPPPTPRNIPVLGQTEPGPQPA